jgi:trimeric autotransporter adhesin
MSIQSISFYQQDQNYWSQAQAQSQATAADTSLINVMGTAETNLAKGLASIANATALKRVNNQITALVQQVLNPSSASSTSSGSTPSSSGSTSSAAGAASTSGSPATGTGTAVLTTSTSLTTLGILPGGTITVGTGPNTTTYTSTGTDTVGDLINAINIDLPTNANVTASLSSSGQLVITSRDLTSAIYVGGSGNDAAAIGFGVGNDTFLPTAAASSPTGSAASPASNSSTSSHTASSSTGSSGAASKTASSSGSSATSSYLPSYLALAEQGVSTAAGILSADGVSGTLVDLLA